MIYVPKTPIYKSEEGKIECCFSLTLQVTPRKIRGSETESLRVVVEEGLERNIEIFDPHPLHSDFTRILTDKQNEFQSALPYEGVQRVL